MDDHELVPARVEALIPYRPGKPVEELERELGIKGALKLASNENPVGPSPRVVEAIRAHAAAVSIYPDGAAFALRQDLAVHWGVPKTEVVLGNGSNELIDLICRTFPASDDHVVFGNPSFVCYWLACVAAGVEFTQVPMIDHLAWDVDALLAAVTPKTKVLFLANPNNPTGAHIGGADLERLCRALPPRVVLVLDEAYAEFADAPDYVSGFALRATRERLLVMRTFSKAYGLAALRVGYAIGPAPLIEYLHRIRAPFNVNAIGQLAARAALADQEHLARYVAMNRVERQRLTESFTATGLRVAPSQANFVLVDFARPGTEVYEALLLQGIIVRPMPPPIETWLRITVGTPEQNTRLEAAVKSVVSG